jgi:TetR/AcrR family transcriptional regulator, fatty acid metabolism regulator protein
MGGVVTEARDGAVDRRGWHVVGTDPEARRHTGSEAFYDDVGPCREPARERSVRRQVADDGFGPGAQSGVPGRSARPHRIPGRWLDADDAGAEPPELATRVGAGEVASEVDDERVGQRLHAAGGYLYSRPALTDGSIASEDKRKRILDAAIRVFAEHGYHGSRVGDIAEDAGVAHGLLYHYFASKDDVLKTIFVENWGQLLKRFKAVEETDEPAEEKLAGIAKILLRTWRNDPALVTVMVREVARSQHIQGQVVEVGEAFAIIQRVIEEGQAAGSLRSDVDARTASWVIYGGLEEVLTGWVLGQLPDGEDDVTRAERVAVEVALHGLSV